MRGGDPVVSANSPGTAGFKSMRRRLEPDLRFAAWSTLGVGVHGSAGRGGQGVSDILRGGSLGFPEKQLSWSRARSGFEFALRHRRSAALGIAAAIGLATAVGLTIGYVRYQRLAAADYAPLARPESPNADLHDALARLLDHPP